MTTVENKTTIVEEVLAAKGVANDAKPVNGISQSTRNLGALIESAMTADTNTGALTVPADTFDRTLPEGHTREMYEQVQGHITQLVAASALATKNKGLEILKENKGLDKIEFTLPIVGKDNITVVFDRSRQVPDRSPDNTGGVRTQFGTTRVGYNVYGTETRGELKKIKNEGMEQASAAFGAMAK